MRFKLGLSALVLVSLVGCKTTTSISSTSALSGASGDIYQIGFETRPNYIDSKSISLTFDDGPDAVNTPKVLDILKANGIKASFFVNSVNWGDIHDPAMQLILKRIVAEGHELANHTANHLDLATLSEAEVENQIASTTRDVEAITGKRMTLIRAPFGSPFQLEEMGSSQANYAQVAKIVSKYGVHIGWNFDSFDYNCAGDPNTAKNCVINNVMTHINNNEYGVILFHSVHAQTVLALPELIKLIKAKGMQFVLVEDILKKRYGKSSDQLLGQPVSGTTPPGNPPEDKGSPVANSCNAPAWVQGMFYKVGSKVVYQNQLFTAINQDNPGYDPKISTWFWEAGALCSSVVVPTKPVEPAKPVEPVKPVEPAKPVEPVKPAEPAKPAEPSGSTIPKAPSNSACSAPAFEEGKSYPVGSTVVFEGQLFTSQNEPTYGNKPKSSPWFWKAGAACR